MIIRFLCCLLAVVLACAVPCRAEESSGATLVRKCDTYLYGTGGRLTSEQAAKEVADCTGFIDAVVAAARLAPEQVPDHTEGPSGRSDSPLGIATAMA